MPVTFSKTAVPFLFRPVNIFLHTTRLPPDCSMNFWFRRGEAAAEGAARQERMDRCDLPVNPVQNATMLLNRSRLHGNPARYATFTAQPAPERPNSCKRCNNVPKPLTNLEISCNICNIVARQERLCTYPAQYATITPQLTPNLSHVPACPPQLPNVFGFPHTFSPRTPHPIFTIQQTTACGSRQCSLIGRPAGGYSGWSYCYFTESARAASQSLAASASAALRRCP